MRYLIAVALVAHACADDAELSDTFEAISSMQLAPSADAYVRSGAFRANNYGGEAALAVKLSSGAADNFNREVYLKFDLSAAPTMSGAKLRLWGSAGGAPEAIAVELRGATNTTWTESGITWDTRPPLGPTSLGRIPLAAAPAWHEWDVGAYLQAERAAGHTAVTFVVISTVPSTTGSPAFASREDATHAPQLVLDTIGAAVPWQIYEAEAGARDAGAAIVAGASWGEVAFEASGKHAVVLAAAGQGVAWTARTAATHATVRYSLPAKATGTLALYVDGAAVATLPIDASRMRESKPGSLPGDTVRFFDDVMVAVPGGIRAGATVRVQKLAADSVPYTIDFLELEAAPPPLAVPDSSWVVVGGSDGNAIRAAIATAASGTKKVWLPARTYVVTDTIVVPAGVRIAGAGMWHTIIRRDNTEINARLFELKGGNTIRDLKIVSNLTTLVAQNVAIRGDGQSGSTIENVWTEYISLFLGFQASTTTLRGNRVRNAYKDSIHIARASVGNLVENNTVRNSGDDSIALVSYDSTGMANNVVRSNTIEVGYWGRGLSNLGGDGNRIENNIVRDYTAAGILVGVEQYSATITAYATNWTIHGNQIVRCGNQVNREMGGAIAIRASVDRPTSGHFERNRIEGSPYDGVQVSGHVGRSGTATVYFRYNTISGPQRVVLASGAGYIGTPNP